MIIDNCVGRRSNIRVYIGMCTGVRYNKNRSKSCSKELLEELFVIDVTCVTDDDGDDGDCDCGNNDDDDDDDDNGDDDDDKDKRGENSWWEQINKR